MVYFDGLSFFVVLRCFHDMLRYINANDHRKWI